MDRPPGESRRRFEREKQSRGRTRVVLVRRGGGEGRRGARTIHMTRCERRKKPSRAAAGYTEAVRQEGAVGKSSGSVEAGP
jgi:hypothetical protein